MLASNIATTALRTAASGTSTTLVLSKLLSAAKGKTAVAGALIALVATLTVWQHLRSKDSMSQTGRHTQSVPSTEQATVAREVATQADAASLNAPGLSQMVLQVVDADTGAPLPESKLHLFYLLQDGRGSAVKQVTDLSGKFGVEMIERPFRNLNMFVTADGHVPKVTSFGEGHPAMPSE